MSEDRWDLASLSPLTSLGSLFIARNAALPLADGDHVKTSTPDGGSALPGLTRSAVVAQTRAPLRIPPCQNPGRRAKKPIASRRSPSPSEDQDGYSDSRSEWKGITPEAPALSSPGHHFPLSPEPYITKSPETRAPSLPAPSIPTSPTHISVWESSPPPDVYHDLPITRQEIVSSVSQRHNHPLPGIPVTSTPLFHHRIEGDHPDSPADSDAGVVPLLESPSSVSILQAQYQALYEDLVELGNNEGPD
ncbi:hypothetical protein FA13DRAFT_1803089 [Coprinellus micaceus]|uniref:Uncharacterized protein n=1 Tax=Coprinellus micaceus TaxID=71717 RepID=A0A4Y7SBN3_COPMI|nr:hypothetical protein FA13DRAFT_1803089 [Coprinellus micaceus]